MAIGNVCGARFSENVIVAMTSNTEVNGTEVALDGEPRWLLIQRIVESRSFERATQLRKILLYVAKTSILEPDRVLREYDIAYDVLDRRKDFDPATDNIVRSQFTHLRRKLEGYFLDEGRAETLIVKIPKGSYVPVFTPVRAIAPVAPGSGWATASVVSSEPDGSVPTPAQTAEVRRGWKAREMALAGVCLALLIGLAWSVARIRGAAAAKTTPAVTGNAFVQFLARTDGKVSVVVPDLMLVQFEDARGGADISLADYLRTDYPQRQLDEIKNRELRDFLESWSGKRSISFDEGMISSNLLETLHQLNVPTQVRFARDVRVSDINGDNTILIGSAASNPWVGLFQGSINFRFFEDRSTNEYYFENVHPAAGEPARYTVRYSNAINDGNAIGYADVVLTQNEMHTGYVLMFVASDEQEVEAAAKFLLRGKLPPEIASILNRKDLSYFELFLRGHHLAGQADNSFELVTVRTR
jgi:hypothetical protein